jgi:hypothetical protein
MTVIAWDGKTLAADKLACFGNTKGTVTKIFRHGAELVGITGTLSTGQEMFEWYKAGAKPTEFPSSNRGADKGSSLVVIRADKTAWKYESGPYPFQMEDPQCAWGCGDETAKVAMACGLNARDAVLMTIRFNTGCGNGVDTLEME